MLATILISIAALVLLSVIIFFMYKGMRTYDANPNHTYVVQSKGEIAGALREPATLWNPSMSVLRDKNAPDINFPAMRQKTGEIYTRSLCDKRTGRIALTVNTCTPPQFRTVTLDGHQYDITANVVFRLDIERIHIPSQLDNFGATLANRIVNLFDNEISALRDEELRGKQTEIEQRVTRALRQIEEADDGEMRLGMPLGIKVYEADFSFREFDPELELETANGEGRPRGPLWVDVTRLDRLADSLDSRTPEVRDAVMRLVELQTRQNIVETLCKSGGLVAFTAKELGLNDLVSDDGAKQSNLMAARRDASVQNNPESIHATSESETPLPPESVETDYYGRPIQSKQPSEAIKN